MSFQPILDAALTNYSRQVGIDLATHPLAYSLRSCGSPNDVLKILEDTTKEFKEFREGNRKLINWLKPVVHVVHTLSTVLGASITLVSRNILFLLFPYLMSSVIRFRSSQQMRSSLAWVFSSQYVSHHPLRLHVSSFPDATGGQWCQLELRCPRRPL